MTTAFNVEDTNEDEGYDQEVFWTHDDGLDDETVATLASENDEGATVVVQFEDAVAEAVQTDPDLAVLFTSYQDARRRLTERVRFRGFWPVKKGNKGSGKKGGKAPGKGKMSLAQKIASSYCRACGQKGHWKAECPKKGSQAQGGSPPPSSSVPIFLAVTDAVPLEILHVPELSKPVPLPKHECEGFGVSHERIPGNKPWDKVRGKWGKGFPNAAIVQRIRNALRHKMMKINDVAVQSDANLSSRPMPMSHDLTNEISPGETSKVCDTHFASSGTTCVVDLGASQTEIGSHQVKELLQGLPAHLQSQVRRMSCQLTF